MASLEGDRGVDPSSIKNGKGTTWTIVHGSGTFAVVPEPATIVMILSATLGAIAYGWRRWSASHGLSPKQGRVVIDQQPATVFSTVAGSFFSGRLPNGSISHCAGLIDTRVFGGETFLSALLADLSRDRECSAPPWRESRIPFRGLPDTLAAQRFRR